MGFKNLEHNGDEDLLEDAITRREEANKISSAIDSRRKIEESKIRDKEQSQWMNFNNPALWDGEI